MAKTSKIYFFTLLCLLLNQSNGTDLTCEFITVPNSRLLNINGPQYACNLGKDFPSLNMAVPNVIGDHQEGKLATDVTVLTVDSKQIFLIPNLVTIFPELIYIKMINTPFRILLQWNLVVYKDTLQHLVISDSKLEIISEDSLDGFINLKTLDLRRNQIFYIAENVFNSLHNLQYLMLDDNQCKDAGSIDIGSFTPVSGSLAEMMVKIEASSCQFSDFKELLKIYQTATVGLDLEVYEAAGVAKEVIEQQQVVVEELERKLGDAVEAKNEVQELYDDLQRNFLALTGDYAVLTVAKEACVAELISNEAEKKELKTQAEFSKAKVEELEPLAEKCMDVNGTCRYTTRDSSYTCIAHNIAVLTPGVVLNWTGTHNPTTLKNKNVETLLIRDLEVHFMPSKIGHAFIKLKTLIIKNCKLSMLSVDDFLHMFSLKTIQITLNEIASIEAGTFDDLVELETLDLSDNKISSLPSKIFTQLTAIKFINLNRNHLTSIKVDIIPTNNNIDYFSATDNQLDKVDSSFVWRLRSANLIDFTGNGCDLKFDAAVGSYIEFYSLILTKC